MSKVYIIKSANGNYDYYEENIEHITLDLEVADRLKNEYNKKLKSKKRKYNKIAEKHYLERNEKEVKFFNDNFDLETFSDAWIDEHELV